MKHSRSLLHSIVLRPCPHVRRKLSPTPAYFPRLNVNPPTCLHSVQKPFFSFSLRTRTVNRSTPPHPPNKGAIKKPLGPMPHAPATPHEKSAKESAKEKPAHNPTDRTTLIPRHFPRRYGVIGTGAVGGLYGGYLQKAGAEVHFLARNDFASLRDHGLHIRSEEPGTADIHLPQVNVHNSPHSMPPCDILLVALKSTQNHLLGTLLPPALAPGGTVVILQNGFGNEEVARKEIGNDDVILVGGLCFLCAQRTQPGTVRHLAYGNVTLGASSRASLKDNSLSKKRSAKSSESIQNICADFRAAGIIIDTTKNLVAERWRKLVWNIPFNGLSVLLDAKTDELLENADSMALTEKLMQETVTAAASCGHKIPESHIQKMMDLAIAMPSYAPSMKVDFNAGRPLEIEAIYGAPLRAAHAAGASLPTIETLYWQLGFLDHRIRQQHT